MGVDGAMTRAAVFLDRDGVINRPRLIKGRPHPPATLAELEVLPGVPPALEMLRARGYSLIVVTNQPDVARGSGCRTTIDLMHEMLSQRLPLDAILTCFHDDADACQCRKPQPGLLLRAAQQLDLDLARSFMVGDRWRDIEAGRRAGCGTFFVDLGYDEAAPSAFDYRVGSLPEAADIIAAREPRP
jgi:D-glycero-D-manno-heptose 1,7-bisphosphate phosphatase